MSGQLAIQVVSCLTAHRNQQLQPVSQMLQARAEPVKQPPQLQEGASVVATHNGYAQSVVFQFEDELFPEVRLAGAPLDLKGLWSVGMGKGMGLRTVARSDAFVEGAALELGPNVGYWGCTSPSALQGKWMKPAESCGSAAGAAS